MVVLISNGILRIKRYIYIECNENEKEKLHKCVFITLTCFVTLYRETNFFFFSGNQPCINRCIHTGNRKIQTCYQFNSVSIEIERYRGLKLEIVYFSII